MLYRLDYLNADGTVRGPVRDFLSRHMTTARKRATEAAAEAELSVQVTRIGKAGQTKATLVIRPDGGAERPAGTRGEDCKRNSGQTCFCRDCRAQRRGTR